MLALPSEGVGSNRSSPESSDSWSETSSFSADTPLPEDLPKEDSEENTESEETENTVILLSQPTGTLVKDSTEESLDFQETLSANSIEPSYESSRDIFRHEDTMEDPNKEPPSLRNSLQSSNDCQSLSSEEDPQLSRSFEFEDKRKSRLTQNTPSSSLGKHRKPPLPPKRDSTPRKSNERRRTGQSQRNDIGNVQERISRKSAAYGEAAFKEGFHLGLSTVLPFPATPSSHVSLPCESRFGTDGYSTNLLPIPICPLSHERLCSAQLSPERKCVLSGLSSSPCINDRSVSPLEEQSSMSSAPNGNVTRFCRCGGEPKLASQMLTDLSDNQVTRLATPPDARLLSKGQSCYDGLVTSRNYHRPHPRPPPAPRPRTLEGSELIPNHSCSPSFRPSRDSSLERNGRDSSCERTPHHRQVRSGFHHSHHRDSTYLRWCEEEDYDSCDDRHHPHRHSYHEGLHHAHLLRPLHPHTRETRKHPCGSRRRSESPCSCPLCLPVMAIPDHCGRTFPYNGMKVGHKSDLCFSESDYIPLWSCHSPRSMEERLLQLEGDKESLQLQVSVLSDQVEAQSEKILDMEAILDQKRNTLTKTEEQLQKELMARSTLETQRLELLNEISNLKLRLAATERENMDFRDKLRLSEISAEHNDGCQSFSPPAASTPLHTFSKSDVSPDCRQTPPPNSRRKIDQFGTMPRHQRDTIRNNLTSPGTISLDATTRRSPKGVMFGKGLSAGIVAWKGAGKRSTSAPNLAETEKLMVEENHDGNHTSLAETKTGQPLQHPMQGTASVSPLTAHRSPSIGHKPTGIKKIFTKLRRSSSGHLENDQTEFGDLKRGGLRSTAAARLGWTSQTGLFREPTIPFSSWSPKLIEEWLANMGLSQYCAAGKCWMEAGNHLANATPHHLEKDLGVRHPLHRKKLQLAISNRILQNNILNKCCAKLDSAWVLRWLDDLGLPQYKDVFNEARVDGLVLNYLTYDDLAFLRISNLLHVTSLKCGIQVLRQHNFDPSVLKRRSVPEEEKQPPAPGDVALWTNHRVMEWLKTVDLSEYAPNLRGSGVHGALMVYEVRFTSEFLASLLSISSSKTLLRRHLSTHFKELVGKEVVQAKRELEISPGYVPLTTTAKIKMPRKSQFSLKRRKTKSDLEFDDLICPFEEKIPRVPCQTEANKEKFLSI